MSTNLDLYKKYLTEISKLANTEGYCTDLSVELIAVVKNVRRDVQLDEEFLESVKRQGILQPILVSVSSADRTGRLTVVCIAGHRRLAAAKKTGLKTIKCISKKLPEKQAIIAALSENVNRAALHPLDLADSLQDLANHGVERSEMENLFNRDKKTIGRFLKMAQWTATAKDLIRRHPGHFNSRLLLALASKRKQPYEIESIVQSLVVANPTRRGPRRQSRRAVVDGLRDYFATHALEEDKKKAIIDALRYLNLIPENERP
jgi:ParB/RepB/Spo0J family partition protein